MRTPADDQVVRFPGAHVLQRQQRPVPRRSARSHFSHRFARLDQREDLQNKRKRLLVAVRKRTHGMDFFFLRASDDSFAAPGTIVRNAYITN